MAESVQVETLAQQTHVARGGLVGVRVRGRSRVRGRATPHGHLRSRERLRRHGDPICGGKLVR